MLLLSSIFTKFTLVPFGKFLFFSNKGPYLHTSSILISSTNITTCGTPISIAFTSKFLSKTSIFSPINTLLLDIAGISSHKKLPFPILTFIVSISSPLRMYAPLSANSLLTSS